MSRGWIAAAIGAVVVAGVGVALALGVLGGGEAERDADEGGSIPSTVAIATTSTEETESTAAAPTTAMTTTGKDDLCAAIDQMTADFDGHLPVEGPEDLETVRTASLNFYTDAVALVEAPEKATFEQVLAYEEALFEWREANGWEPTRSLEALTDNPPPTAPADAFAIVSHVFEDRCGVVPVRG